MVKCRKFYKVKFGLRSTNERASACEEEFSVGIKRKEQNGTQRA